MIDPTPEVYPCAPLRAVAMEVRYPPVLDAMAKAGNFQRLSDGEFTPARTRRHEDRQGERARRSEGVLLMNQKGDGAVWIGPEKVAVVTYLYDGGHSKFAAWGSAVLMNAVKEVAPMQLTSAAYRYENNIDGPWAQRPMRDLFRLSFPQPTGASDARNVHMIWTQEWPSIGTVQFWLDNCPHYDAKAIRLDILGKIAVHDIERVGDAIQGARTIARQSFESIITDTFREYLRGQ